MIKKDAIPLFTSFFCSLSSYRHNTVVQQSSNFIYSRRKSLFVTFRSLFATRFAFASIVSKSQSEFERFLIRYQTSFEYHFSLLFVRQSRLVQSCKMESRHRIRTTDHGMKATMNNNNNNNNNGSNKNTSSNNNPFKRKRIGNESGFTQTNVEQNLE